MLLLVLWRVAGEPAVFGGEELVSDDDERADGADDEQTNVGVGRVQEEMPDGQHAEKTEDDDGATCPSAAVEVEPDERADAAEKHQNQRCDENCVEGERGETVVGAPVIGDATGEHDGQRAEQHDAEEKCRQLDSGGPFHRCQCR
jgi:hypothetical protein